MLTAPKASQRPSQEPDQLLSRLKSPLTLHVKGDVLFGKKGITGTFFSKIGTFLGNCLKAYMIGGKKSTIDSSLDVDIVQIIHWVAIGKLIPDHW